MSKVTPDAPGILHPASPSRDDGQYGALLDAEAAARCPSALVPAWVDCTTWPATLPSSFLLSGLPTVVAQGTPQHFGSPGSCEAQAYGYGLGTYTVAQANEYDPTDPNYQTSPAWLYMSQLAGASSACPKGTMAQWYLQQLITEGCPSAAQVPYTPTCAALNAISLPLAQYQPVPERFVLGSYATMNVARTADVILAIKAFIASGQAVAFSGLVLEGYADPPMVDGVIVETQTKPKSGHGQLIVGYDDTRGPPNNLGAFLVQNSFGPEWPTAADGGRVWWSYETFLKTQASAAVAYPLAPGLIVDAPLGQTLAGSDPAAPAASVEWISHWAPSTAGAYLVVLLAFAEAVTIESVAIAEEDVGMTATGEYANPMACGYVYFCRTDGNQFDNATFDLTITASVGGSTVTYTGAIAVPAAGPAVLPAAPIASDTPMTDTLGQAVTIT